MATVITVAMVTLPLPFFKCRLLSAALGMPRLRLARRESLRIV
jgi:hypothetical protein